MNEVFFNFEGHEFDLDFSHDNLSNLYIIYDKVSKYQVSRIIEAINDLVAIRGFETIVNDAKKNNDYSILQLYNLGDICYESKKIYPNKDNLFVCDSNFNFKKFYEESFAWLNSQED